MIMRSARRRGSPGRRFGLAIAVAATLAAVGAGPASAGLLDPETPLPQATSSVENALSEATSALENPLPETTSALEKVTKDATSATPPVSALESNANPLPSPATVTKQITEPLNQAAAVTPVAEKTTEALAAVEQTAARAVETTTQTVAPAVATVQNTVAPVVAQIDRTLATTTGSLDETIATTLETGSSTINDVTASLMERNGDVLGPLVQPVFDGVRSSRSTLDGTTATLPSTVPAARAAFVEPTPLIGQAADTPGTVSGGGTADSTVPPDPRRTTARVGIAPSGRRGGDSATLGVVPGSPLAASVTGSATPSTTARPAESPGELPPSAPLAPAGSAASGSSNGFSVPLFAAIAATLLLAAQGVGRRLRPLMALPPLPIFDLSLERPG